PASAGRARGRLGRAGLGPRDLHGLEDALGDDPRYPVELLLSDGHPHGFVRSDRRDVRAADQVGGDGGGLPHDELVLLVGELLTGLLSPGELLDPLSESGEALLGAPGHEGRGYDVDVGPLEQLGELDPLELVGVAHHPSLMAASAPVCAPGCTPSTPPSVRSSRPPARGTARLRTRLSRSRWPRSRRRSPRRSSRGSPRPSRKLPASLSARAGGPA